MCVHLSLDSNALGVICVWSLEILFKSSDPYMQITFTVATLKSITPYRDNGAPLLRAITAHFCRSTACVTVKCPLVVLSLHTAFHW